MYDHAETIVRSTVQALNQHSLDAVFVLGDVTEAGRPAQLALARDVLTGLRAPWFVLPGNHDRAAVSDGDFDHVFAGHVIQPYVPMQDIGFVGLRERLPVEAPGQRGYLLDEAWMERALALATADCPANLVVLSHFPLADESLWAARQGGKDVGHFVHGETLLSRLVELQSATRAGCEPSGHKVLTLCGHQHWHHISTGRGWIQCVTAALIEYPMEPRILSVEGDLLRISTLDSSVDTIAAGSVESATWVRGVPQDRDGSFTLRMRPQVG